MIRQLQKHIYIQYLILIACDLVSLSCRPSFHIVLDVISHWLPCFPCFHYVNVSETQNKAARINGGMHKSCSFCTWFISQIFRTDCPQWHFTTDKIRSIFFSCRCNIYITCCSNDLSQRSAKIMKIAGMIMWKGKKFGLEVSNLTSHVYYLHWDILNSNQLNTKALR